MSQPSEFPEPASPGSLDRGRLAAAGKPDEAGEPADAGDARRLALVAAAQRQWIDGLTDLGGRNTLLYYKDRQRAHRQLTCRNHPPAPTPRPSSRLPAPRLRLPGHAVASGGHRGHGGVPLGDNSASLRSRAPQGGAVARLRRLGLASRDGAWLPRG